MIAVLSFFENWVPPLPADAAIALGALITSRGGVTPLGVFLVTWIPNVAGAMSVWAVSRRYGRRFFAGALGQRLFSVRALHFVETEYRRYGGFGLFIVKLLPGVRAIAAPFAGMANVSFLGALWPMALASAIWYGALTFLGSWLGHEWHRIRESLGGALWPAIAGLVAVGALIVVVVVRRRRREGGPADD